MHSFLQHSLSQLENNHFCYVERASLQTLSKFFPQPSKTTKLFCDSVLRFFSRGKNLIRNAKSELNYQRIKKFNQLLNCDQNKRNFFVSLAAGLLSFFFSLSAAAAAVLHSITQKRGKSHLNMKLFGWEKVFGVEKLRRDGEWLILKQTLFLLLLILLKLESREIQEVIKYCDFIKKNVTFLAFNLRSNTELLSFLIIIFCWFRQKIRFNQDDFFLLFCLLWFGLDIYPAKVPSKMIHDFWKICCNAHVSERKAQTNRFSLKNVNLLRKKRAKKWRKINK